MLFSLPGLLSHGLRRFGFYFCSLLISTKCITVKELTLQSVISGIYFMQGR